MGREAILATGLLLASWIVVQGVVAVAPVGSPVASPSLPASGSPTWTDFTLQDIRGEPVSLRRFIGKKPVLLVFWATWCPHCNTMVPEINRLHSDPAIADRMQILALDYLESPQKVESFIRRKKVSYPVLLDRKGTVARMYRVVGIPTYVLIDRAGRIAYRGHELPEVSGLIE